VIRLAAIESPRSRGIKNMLVTRLLRVLVSFADVVPLRGAWAVGGPTFPSRGHRVMVLIKLGKGRRETPAHP